MNESVDLRRFLEAWPYDPENDARIVSGDDGRQVLQVRTPVGIEQYEIDGRPDGAKPYGAESVLEYHLERLEQARLSGKEHDFTLTEDQASEIFSEGTLYYFRYVRLFQLHDWQRTARDTARNLRAFNIIREYAEREEDRFFLEKWRPYVVRVNASALAMNAVENKSYDQALEIIRKAIEETEALEEMEDETFRFERDRSLLALNDLATQIKRDRPMTKIERMERQLRRAIERQEFERAAELRDKIKAAKEKIS